jgi:hypothetical protein
MLRLETLLHEFHELRGLKVDVARLETGETPVLHGLTRRRRARRKNQ